MKDNKRKAKAPKAKRLADVMDIPIGELLRSDDEFARMFERRLSRLRAMAAESGGLSRRFEECVALTERCNAQGVMLGVHLGEVRKALPKTAEESFARVASKSERPQPGFAGGDDEFEKEFEATREGVRTLLRGLVSSQPSLSGADVVRLIDEHLEGVDEDFAGPARMHGQMLWMAFDNYVFQLSSMDLMRTAMMAQGLRGLLYVCIFDTEGASLDKKSIAGRMVELGESLGGVAHTVISPAVALGRLLWELLEEERVPSSIADAARVDKYLRDYTSLLEQWLEGGGVYRRSLGRFTAIMNLERREKDDPK